MPDLTVVPVETPNKKDLLEGVEELLEHCKNDKIEFVYYLAIYKDGSYRVKGSGKPQDRLRIVGTLESLKFDLLNTD